MEITTPTDSSPPPRSAPSMSKSPDHDTNGISTAASAGSAAPGAADGRNGTGSARSNSPSSRPSEPGLKTDQQQPLSAGSSASSIPAAAAPAVHQPKIVQTAFIHKLYK